MPKLSASVSFLFTEHPLPERFAEAAAAGFAGVECIDPYSLSPDQLARALRRHDLELVLFNLPAGNWAAGDRGLAADPARRAAFVRSLDLGIEYARETDCKRIHVMAGRVPVRAHRQLWRDTLTSNLHLAAARAGDLGIDILLEPLNSRIDAPGYFYDTTDAVCAILDELAAPNVRLLFDVYHRQVMQGDILRGLETLMPRLGHIQIADNPGRHEPGTGEIAYERVLSRIDALGYAGWVGCEYQPARDTASSLAWARPLLRSSS